MRWFPAGTEPARQSGRPPMTELMGKRAHVSEIAIHNRRTDEGFLLRHRDLVGRQRVEGAVAAVIDPGASVYNNALELGRPAHGTEVGFLGRGRREAGDLRCIEDRRCAQDAPLAVVIVGGLLDDELAKENDLRSLFALARLRADADPLLVAGPQAGRVLVHVGSDPEHQDVDAAIGAFRGRFRRDVQRAARRPMPWHDGIAGTGLDLLQDRRGDAIVDGVFVCHGIVLECQAARCGLDARSPCTSGIEAGVKRQRSRERVALDPGRRRAKRASGIEAVSGGISWTSWVGSCGEASGLCNGPTAAAATMRWAHVHEVLCRRARRALQDGDARRRCPTASGGISGLLVTFRKLSSQYPSLTVPP